jgi:acyl-coenzyme A synthetase/AMP-(fatty) acid ligase
MGGIKEPPFPIEEQLRADARIKDAAIVGFRGNDGAEMVGIAIVPEGGADLSDFWGGTERFLWEQRRVKSMGAVMDDLPRTENGKVSRAKLREFFAEKISGKS